MHKNKFEETLLKVNFFLPPHKKKMNGILQLVLGMNNLLYFTFPKDFNFLSFQNYNQEVNEP